jgi:hypothetical protein
MPAVEALKKHRDYLTEETAGWTTTEQAAKRRKSRERGVSLQCNGRESCILGKLFSRHRSATFRSLQCSVAQRVWMSLSRWGKSIGEAT